MCFKKFFYSKAYITIMDYLDHSRIGIKSPEIAWIRCLTMLESTGPLLRAYAKLCREEGWFFLHQFFKKAAKEGEIWSWTWLLVPKRKMSKRWAPKRKLHGEKERNLSFFCVAHTLHAPPFFLFVAQSNHPFTV